MPVAMKSTAKGRRRRRHPCILSCGYRSVYIPKSGLSFPAWLVCFDDSDQEAENEEDGFRRVETNRVKNKPQQQQSEPSAAAAATTEDPAVVETIVCGGRRYWRSKRDFLRLARAVPASSSTIVFPKAAWKKLSNEAPWKRPDYNDYGLDHEEEEAHDDSLEERNQNGWKRHMYKSLRQVDQYLQQVQSLCRKSNDEIDNHQADNRKVYAEQEQLQYRFRSSAGSILQEAWQEFCRPGDTESLLLVDHDESTAAAASPANTAMMTGNALGQYFCHPTNARQLVKVCLERVFAQKQALLSRNRLDDSTTTTTTTTTRTRFIFVEPSCGHGQVLEILLDELKRRQELQSSSSADSSSCGQHFQLDLKQCSSFVGMDIDPTAIAHCREHFSQKQQYPNITWTNQDFLQSKRACIMNNIQRENGEETIMVIVLGGPPYSAGAGNGGNMKLDLPMRFVEHAMKEWDASVVTFFMPERCGRASHTYNSDDGNCSGPERAVDMNEDSMQANENDRHNRAYSTTNIPLEAPSVFYFRGLSSAPVTQPSIIQCFDRKEADRSKQQVL